MDEPQVWKMPAAPPADVISVRDCDGHQYERYQSDGEMWLDPGAGRVYSWDYLIFNRGPITADELVA